MLTILDVLNRTTDFFREKGIPDPKLDTEYLLADALGMKRLDLFLQFEKPLPEVDLEAIRERVRRRSRREPLQHILGYTPFCGLRIKTDARALIPRPETEQLVECIGDRCDADPELLVDLGTGSGAIALALAVKFPAAGVLATDVDPEALALAGENIRENGAAERIQLINTNWFEGIDGPFDLAVSNPPYLSEAEWKRAEPEVRKYEPAVALQSPRDGSEALLQIVEQAYDKLKSGALLALETGVAHHAALETAARARGYSRWEGVEDYQGRPRFFFAWK